MSDLAHKLSRMAIQDSQQSGEGLLRRGQHGRRNPPTAAASRDSDGGSGGSFDEEEILGSSMLSGSGTMTAPPPLSREQREAIRFSMVKRKKDFKCMERVEGRSVNLLQGLELHTGIFSAAEQKKIVDCVYGLQKKGRNGELRERTYSEPKKWMRGKGRVTLQFGCCYNYAVDKHGNPPGIIRDEQVDPIPPLLKIMIKRMVEWHVLPPTCVPNSCIINIYDKDDCIPPHIDHHDFLRPFCTVSLLSECNILFGAQLKILGPGEFSGLTAIPLPVGSVLILNGNGADVAKHCVPAVPSKRISITFRKMDDKKLPYRFIPDSDLQNLRPLTYPSKQLSQQLAELRPSTIPQQDTQPQVSKVAHDQHGGKPLTQGKEQKVTEDNLGGPFKFNQDDFPTLGSVSSSLRSRPNRPLRQ